MTLALSPVNTARWLLVGVMVALLLSPPVTVALELALYAVMLGSAECRARLARVVREPLAAMALAFWLLAALGVLYSIAPWRESLEIWFAWRRLLLLVFALALFEEIVWKRRLAWILVTVAVAGALLSYASAFGDFSFRPSRLPVGIVFRNYAMQGMVFAVAAFAAALLLRQGAGLAPVQRIFLAAVSLLLCANVVFVTTARSGYAVLLVLGVVLAYSWPKDASRLKRAGWTAAGAVTIAAALASSPIVQQRMQRGVSEIENYARGTEVSAMGERVIYMRNALELAAERPLLGYGTGSFGAAYAKKVEGRPGREGIQTPDPHNAYLSIAVQHGLVGLAVFLALLGAALRQPASAPYRLLGLGALAAWCVTSFFSGHFSTFAEGRFIWLWLGVCLAPEATRSP